MDQSFYHKGTHENIDINENTSLFYLLGSPLLKTQNQLKWL
jgi:hypothetical protein